MGKGDTEKMIQKAISDVADDAWLSAIKICKKMLKSKLSKEQCIYQLDLMAKEIKKG